MAQLLVKAVDATRPDPVKDQRGCYKRGMVVVVADDKHEWGRLECPPKFFVVKLPGVPVEKAQHYLEPETEVDEKGDQVAVRRRLWKIEVDTLPKAATDKIDSAGALIVASKDADIDVETLKSVTINQKTRESDKAELKAVTAAEEKL